MFIEPENIGLDSNCLTYFIMAMEGIQEPTAPIPHEMIALVRISFYCRFSILLSPTVITQCSAIQDKRKQAQHKSWMLARFGSMNPEPDKQEVDNLAQHINKYHKSFSTTNEKSRFKKFSDCQILAEYKLFGKNCGQKNVIKRFFTCDEQLVKSSSQLAFLKPMEIIKPSVYWKKINLEKGSRTVWTPHSSNPLSLQSWWKWDK